MENKNIIDDALEFAMQKHSKQQVNGKDFIEHPKLVYQILLETEPENTNILVAALLHDTLEDTNTSIKKLKKLFGKQIASLVVELTDAECRKKEVGNTKYHSLKMLNLSDDALSVKLADRLSHSINIFNMSDKRMLKRSKVTSKIIKFLEKNRKLTDTHIKLIDRFNEVYSNLLKNNDND